MPPIRRSRLRLVSGALACAAVVAGVAIAVHGGLRASARVRNVILIVVDTLRADHLGLYGYERDTSPNLSRLARSAVVFEGARSQAPCTFPSVNSLLTSRHPVTFMGQPGGAMTIPEGVPSLAEILGQHGFTSSAVSASEVVRATPSRFNRSGGFGRGFASFDESCPDGRADCVNQRVADFLGDGPTPTFLYVHYMDPHGPYAPPHGYPRRFATWKTGNRVVDSGDPVAVANQIVRPAGPGAARPLRPEERQHLIDLYDDEIGYWDSQLALLFEQLAARGRLDDTLVVLTADHGEGFAEHGTLAHCRTVFDSETHVPLLMWIPGVDGRRLTAPVENLDVVPTVLDYLGIAAPGLEGTSLRGYVEGRAGAPHRFVHSFHVLLRSASDDRHKGILDVASGALQVYDLVADPTEQTDLVAQQKASPELVAELRDELQRSTREHEGERGTAWSADASGDVVERLRSLGYMH